MMLLKRREICIVTVKTSSGTSQWVVSETIDEIYAMLEGDEILGLDKTKKPLYD